MRNQIIQGNVLNPQTWEIIPAGLVQTCITSPPYWGLRDYGVDGQIGLEKTPEEFVARMVQVFRQVWRILRDDGTLWLNLGSSYASGGRNPNQSPLLRRVPACGNDGKLSPDFPLDDRAYPDSCGEPQGETQNRRDCTARNDQYAEPDGPPTLLIAHDSGLLDCDQASLDASLPGAPLSTKLKSSVQSQAASSPSAKALASPQESLIASCSVPPSEHNSVCTSGTSLMSPPLVVRTRGKESFYSACQSPDCQGIGRCGLCWCSLTIPSLSIKQKDEINMPHLVAMALQADGWILRQTIIWHKPAPMPESCRDRCTKAHEYIFLLTKKPKCFCDMNAIREPQTCIDKRAGRNSQCLVDRSPTPRKGLRSSDPERFGLTREHGAPNESCTHPGGRNKRSVWTVATAPYSEAHFATFPPKLIEPCVLAGTSAKGCCPECGKPWERVVERTQIKRDRPNDYVKRTGEIGTGNCINQTISGVNVETTGWKPGCKCGRQCDTACNCGQFHQHKPVPCIVFDPFMGSGTTAMVARQHGRDYLGIELNPEYIALSDKRIATAALPLLDMEWGTE